MNREVHVRIYESRGVKFPPATRGSWQPVAIAIGAAHALATSRSVAARPGSQRVHEVVPGGPLRLQGIPEVLRLLAGRGVLGLLELGQESLVLIDHRIGVVDGL